MRKFKWISKLFCLCLLLATLAISASAAENTTEFAGGEGTEESPYLIANATHLNNVRNYLGAQYKMTADIVFTDADFAEGGAFYNDGSGWTPMGTNSSKKFTGIFNGDGHTITGLKQNISASSTTYGGLFGYVSGATIKNLGMVDAEVGVTTSSGDAYAGAIAGYLYYRDTTIISNCYNTGVVSAIGSSKTYAGGIVGYAYSGSSISNCYNTGAVSATSSADSSYAGGIVGYGKSISKCYSSGVVTATSSASDNVAYSANAGGIAGYLRSGIISDGYNTGVVTAIGDRKGAHAGGIAGYMHYDSSVRNCYNTGTVSASGSKTTSTYTVCAGGIVGDAYSDGSTISNCYNTGEVMASGSTSNGSFKTYAGGIAGEGDGVISNCYNTGRISATSTTEEAADSYTGGIAGYMRPGSAINNCYNTGRVSAISSASDTYSYSANAGGIIGRGNGSISNCYNIGAAMANAPSYTYTASYVGGIAGYLYGDGTINNCYYLNTASKGVESGTDTATKCTGEKMKLSSTFANFDFADTWTMFGDTAYPYPELQYVGMAGADGHGTESNPYLISTKAHLNAVRNDLDAHYKMIADIVFTEADFAEGGAFYNNGAGWVSIGNGESPFMGFFDGDGYTISGLKQNISATEDVYGGLFGYASGATIKNVGMLNSDLSVKTTDGYVYAGGVVGYLSVSTIKNCHNTGTVSASAWSSDVYADAHAGGIAGEAIQSAISICYNSGMVTASSLSSSSYAYAGGIAGDVYGGSTISECDNTGEVTAVTTSSSSYVSAEAGGIVGYISESTVSNCYNTGAVSADSHAGGIAGNAGDTAISNCYNTGTVSGDDAGGIAGCAIPGVIISNCYNTGTAKADDHAGGIVGWAEYYRTISNCYNTGAVSGGYAGGIAGYATGQINYDTIKDCYYLDNCSVGVGIYEDAGTKCTAAQMKQQETFAGFDFDEVWTMAGDKDYPYPELQVLMTADPASVDISSVSTTSATLTIANNEAGKCYVAIYSNEGKMLSYGLTPITADAGETTVSLAPFTTTSPYTVKAFLVDSQGIPTCAYATTE